MNEKIELSKKIFNKLPKDVQEQIIDEQIHNNLSIDNLLDDFHETLDETYGAGDPILTSDSFEFTTSHLTLYTPETAIMDIAYQIMGQLYSKAYCNEAFEIFNNFEKDKEIKDITIIINTENYTTTWNDRIKPYLINKQIPEDTGELLVYK